MILYLVPLILFAGILFLAFLKIYRGPYQKWSFFYQMLAKWALITFICGAYSFFLGLMISGSRFIPMLAAMGITAFGLAWLESRQITVGMKGRFPLLRQSMKYGTRIRLFVSFLIVFLPFLEALDKSPAKFFIFVPTFLDMTIGQFVISGYQMVGFDMRRVSGGGYRDIPEDRSLIMSPYSEWFSQLGVFAVSLTTAAIHVMILGLIVLLIWGVLSLYVSLRRGKPT